MISQFLICYNFSCVNGDFHEYPTFFREFAGSGMPAGIPPIYSCIITYFFGNVQ